MFEQILEEIKQAKTIIIHRHTNPDGDALGSQTGLYHLIKDNFPDKDVYMVGDDSKRFGFIADTPMSNIPDSLYSDALAIVLDTSADALISDKRYKTAKRTARIDHHIFLEKLTNTEVVNTSYESCAGLVTAFAMECNLKVSDKAATALFTGTVTDSGRFRFDSTSSDTYKRVAFLTQNKIDTNAIYKKLYTDTIESLRLRAKFILKAQFTENNVGYIYTSKEDMIELGIGNEYTASRGYVNVLSDLEGVSIWAAFAEGDNGIICELRSSDKNINPIAVKYGGGGHAKASGATVKDKKTAMAMLEDLNKLAGEK